MTNAQEPEWLQAARENGLTITETGVNQMALATKAPDKAARRPGKRKPSTRTVDDGQTVAEKPKSTRRKEEAKFQADVIKLAHLRGYKAAHFRSVRVANADGTFRWMTPVGGDGRDFPDLVIAKDGHIVVAELKVRPNKPKAGQLAWLALFKAAFIPTYVWYPEDWDMIKKILR